MKEHFRKRTDMHIRLFQKYFKRIINLNPKLQAIESRLQTHDRSKYVEPEYIPYVYLTWDYKCKREGVDYKIPKKIQKKLNKAIYHHIITNKHHPEAWHPFWKMGEIVNAESMSIIYIMEMMADWCAVSEEKGTDPFDWLAMNVGKRWTFTDEQVKLMIRLLQKIWK